MRYLAAILVSILFLTDNLSAQKLASNNLIPNKNQFIPTAKISIASKRLNSVAAPAEAALVANSSRIQYVGYGFQNHNNATMGSVASVLMDDRQAGGYNNMAEYLQGRVPGLSVEPTSTGYRVLIRGLHTFTGSNNPLIVVNGIVQPLSRTIEQIDPYNVKSVDVLKGPAAAIYGSRGANGVIVINTK